MNDAYKWALTAVCFIAFCLLYGGTMFDLGRDAERERCRPTTVPKKMGYDMSKKQMLRWIKYEQSKGGVS